MDDRFFYASLDGDIVSIYDAGENDVYIERSEESLRSLPLLERKSYNNSVSGWEVKAERASEADSVGDAVEVLLPEITTRPLNEEILEEIGDDGADRDRKHDMTSYRAATAPVGMDHGEDDLRFS